MRHITGIRPSGSIHLGNYLGAIKQARDLGSLVFIADLHGIHTKEEVDSTRNILSDIGIEAEIQSAFGYDHLRLHAELLHHATIGHLSRMTQYKDKSDKEAQTAALLTYPVLMAADIFFLRGERIPVGNDQVQHIEYIRDLHDKVKPDCPKPEAVVSKYPRIMSLTDGTRKMSKSDSDDMSRINLTDDTRTIRDKIMVAKTSMNMDDDTPEMANLRTIYAAVGGLEKHTRFKQFKAELADLIISELARK